MYMEKLCIIADDLTGATDTGVQFSKFGIPTAVIFDYLTLKDLTISFNVVAVNAETRNIDREAAYLRVKKIVGTLHDMNFNVFYKKIDSTLRGQPDVEVEAMLDELGFDLAFVVPSYPANGRKMENGYLYIERDHESGQQNVPIGFVPDVFKTIRRPVALIRIADVRKGVLGLKEKINDLRASNNQVLIIDAVTNADLMNIAAAIQDHASRAVITGSAGLASCLPTTWGLLQQCRQLTRQKPILFLAGTRNAVTAQQIKTFSAFTSVKVVEVDSKEIIEGKNEEEVNRVTNDVRKALKEGRIPVVAIDSLLRSDKEVYSQEVSSEDASKIAKSFGVVARNIASENLIYALVVTGGDVAMNVFNAMEAKGIILENEIVPGIPVGHLIGGKFEGLHVVTKAGGFGEKDSFIQIARYFKDTAKIKEEVVSRESAEVRYCEEK